MTMRIQNTVLRIDIRSDDDPKEEIQNPVTHPEESLTADIPENAEAKDPRDDIQRNERMMDMTENLPDGIPSEEKVIMIEGLSDGKSTGVAVQSAVRRGNADEIVMNPNTIGVARISRKIGRM